jgi:hypothetical protein
VQLGADTIAENVRDDQVKIKAQGWALTPELIAMFNPFRTHHLKRMSAPQTPDREADFATFEFG